jgi:hypothetical protein
MPPRLAAAVLLRRVAAVLGVLAPASAPASCVGPQITMDAGATAPRGEQLAVDGRYFHSGCADAIELTSCSGPRASDPESPSRHVELRLVQGDRSWRLGEADAGDATTQYAIRWRVTVPDDVSPGAAQLVAGTATASIEVSR